jgi:single-strand selective monofunctional uracil DNA glycosylase
LVSIDAQALVVLEKLRATTGRLAFGDPVAHVYHPLDYAWPMMEAYVRRYGAHPKRAIFVGMNPGPWGMAQTGIPFGEVAAVRDWLKLAAPIGQPRDPHPSRPVTGLACRRAEVSGKRLWGLFAARFGDPAAFFADYLVVNYCPLLFLEAGGRNRTPDKLPAAEGRPLQAACDAALAALVDLYRPRWCIGVGAYAQARLQQVVRREETRVGVVLHPSPASPAANRGWAEAATRQLEELGVW